VVEGAVARRQGVQWYVDAVEQRKCQQSEDEKPAVPHVKLCKLCCASPFVHPGDALPLKEPVALSTDLHVKQWARLPYQGIILLSPSPAGQLPESHHPGPAAQPWSHRSGGAQPMGVVQQDGRGAAVATCSMAPSAPPLFSSRGMGRREYASGIALLALGLHGPHSSPIFARFRWMARRRM